MAPLLKLMDMTGPLGFAEHVAFPPGRTACRGTFSSGEAEIGTKQRTPPKFV